jgi:hypothetical protein
MESTSHRNFHYHASAHALSGALTHPLQHVIEVQAGMSLPSTGGVGSSRVEGFRLDEVVSFRKGSSHVSGSTKNVGDTIIHTTYATATIEGLNILDMVTADRIVARLSSSYDSSPRAVTAEAPAKKTTESSILLVGTKFENLRIAGCPVDVELHHELLLELGTFADVQEKWKDPDGDLRHIGHDTLRGLAVPDDKFPQSELDSHGALLCSIVKKVHFKDPGFERDEEVQIRSKDEKTKEQERKHKNPCPGVERLSRHAFRVQDFGRIFLSEVLFQHGRKTLTMLRVELGSPNGGGFTGVEASINGRPPMVP